MIVRSTNENGLANRLKALASALYYVEGDATRVAIHWPRKYSVDCAFDNLFAMPVRTSCEHSVPLIFSTWRLYIKDSDELPLDYGQASVQFQNQQGQICRHIDFEYERVPFTLRRSYGKIFKQITDSIRPEIVEQAMLTLSEFKGSFAAVHIRTWFDDPPRKRLYSFESYQQEALNLLRSGITQIFITSDCTAAALSLRGFILEKEPAACVQLSRQSHSLSSTQLALADLYILSQASILVISPLSTFSEVAWWMSGCSCSIVRPVVADVLAKSISIQTSQMTFSCTRDCGTHISNAKTLESAVQRFTKRYGEYFKGLTPNDRHYMIDVGAHIGLAAIGPLLSGFRVLAFEPIADNFQCLQRNVRQNGIPLEQFVAFNVALGQDDGFQTIYLPEGRGDNASLNRVSANANVRKAHVKSCSVPIVRLDSVLQRDASATSWNAADARLLKIDVQGAELQVLRGAEQFLRAAKQHSHLLIELEWDAKLAKQFDCSPREIPQLLYALGYHLQQPRTLQTLEAAVKFLETQTSEVDLVFAC